jgi:site-specific recombinase XerD
VPSNQKYNVYLKEIMNICNIDINLTTHTARHTFATTIALDNGISMETVSKILGHSNTKITQHYGKITDTRIRSEMLELNNKLNDKNEY